MRSLLFTIIGSITFASAVNAESVWLILLHSSNGNYTALEKIEMLSMDQCLEQGKTWIGWLSTPKNNYIKGLGYRCLIGK